MALDARHRSSLFQKFIPMLGEDDANALMSAFPSIEADELVTKQFLRAELAEVRTEIADVRTDMADLRADVHQAMHRQSVTIVALVIAATAVIEALTALV